MLEAWVDRSTYLSEKTPDTLLFISSFKVFKLTGLKSPGSLPQ